MCVLRVGILLVLWVLSALRGSLAQNLLVKEPVCNFVLEMIHLQDYSRSFSDDIPELHRRLPELLDGVSRTYPGSRYGLGSFVDKPLKPFGYESQGAWFAGDWCLEVSSPLSTGDPQEIVDALIMETNLGGGLDWPENQLGALYDVAVNSSLAGWTDRTHDEKGFPIVRVISLSTDAAYHKAGDGFKSKWHLSPNDGDGYTSCIEEDYPSVDQVKNALNNRLIYTIFLAGDAIEEGVVDIYDELLDVTGLKGASYHLSADSSDILETMAMALETLNNKTCIRATFDVALTVDVTASFDNDAATLFPKIDALSFELEQEYITPRFALTTFADKPISPFGFAVSGDYCYRLEQPLTYNRTEFVRTAKQMRRVSGADWKESTLDAIISTVVDPEMKWRTGDMWNGFQLFRVLVVATDAGFHTAPDAAEKGYSLAAHSGGMVNCTGEEYPTWQQAAKALLLKGVHPLFVPTSDIASIYRKLLRKMEAEYGIVGEVVELKDFGELEDVVMVGVRRLEAKLRTQSGLELFGKLGVEGVTKPDIAKAANVYEARRLGSIAKAEGEYPEGFEFDYIAEVESADGVEMVPSGAVKTGLTITLHLIALFLGIFVAPYPRCCIM